MACREKSLVLVMAEGSQSALSPMQKKFKQLIKKIDQHRQKLKKYQESKDFYLKEQQRLYWPLLDEFRGYQEKLVVLLDNAYAEKGFNKTEKEKIRDIILTICDSFLSEKPNPFLEEIYKKHTISTDENDAASYAEEMKFMREMAENLFNVRLDDSTDLNSVEAIQAAVEKAVEEKLQAKAREKEQAEESVEQFTSKSAQNNFDKMSKRQREIQEEEKNISHSIREIYRKLASSLHPDREQDLVERERKTELMQRVNTAYANKDLLLLLELQLEIEQIDQQSIARISEEKLMYYNKILGEQAKELQNEIRGIEFRLRRIVSVPSRTKLKPDILTEILAFEVNELHEKIRIIQRNIIDFANAKKLKKMLRSYVLPEDEYDDYEYDLFGIDETF